MELPPWNLNLAKEIAKASISDQTIIDHLTNDESPFVALLTSVQRSYDYQDLSAAACWVSYAEEIGRQMAWPDHQGTTDSYIKAGFEIIRRCLINNILPINDLSVAADVHRWRTKHAIEVKA